MNEIQYIPPEMANKIVIKDAIKIYKRGKIEVVALRGLECDFYKGEITVIMGPSGCGKTTLLNMIGGLDRLNSGKIIVDGNDIAQLSDNEVEIYRRNNIGFVFQFMNLIPELTAEENVMLPLELAGTLTREKRDFIHQLMNTVGLEERKTHRPDELSGGEQQRISLAAALANNPTIILCDEPTGELDTQSKRMVMELLRSVMDLYPDKYMIIVSHDMDLRAIADRLYYIRDGAISHKFTKAELQESVAEQAAQGGDSMITYKQGDKGLAQELALLELREINHIVEERIEKIEKKLHPI